MVILENEFERISRRKLEINGNEGVAADVKTVAVTIIESISLNFETVMVTIILMKLGDRCLPSAGQVLGGVVPSLSEFLKGEPQPNPG